MYVGLHNVYPAMDVNFAFRRKVKMTATCDFVSLGEKMRELFVKNGKGKKKNRKKKEREKNIDHMTGQKRREIFLFD